MSALPQAYHHPSPLSTLIPHLIPLLPNSLPLLRRIQFQPANSIEKKPAFPNAHVFATFPPSTPPPPPSSPHTNAAPLDLDPQNPPAPPFAFTAAWVDRSSAPETECWIFSTYEVRDEHGNFPTAGFPPSNPARGPADEKIDYALRATPRAEEARRGLLAILNAIAGLLPVKDGEGGREEEEEEILVIGSLHTCLLPLLTSPTDHHHNLFPFQRVLSRSRAANPTSGVLSGIEQATYKYLIPPAPPSTPTNNSSSNGSDDAGGVLSGIGQATYKYLIPPAPSTLSSSDGISGLGRGKGKKGYVLSELRSSELGICIANTDIPRTEEGLGMLRSVCVRYCSPPVEEQPREKKRGVGGEGEERDKGKGKGDGYREEGEVVAWAFLGADGSFSSLHTMPEHRGKGLAGAVVRGLMRKGEGWMSSDVYWDNEGGKGVARGLGGREGWVVHWVGCDLEAVRRVWGWHGS